MHEILDNRGEKFKQIIHKCVVYCQFEGLPYCAPPAPPLPSFRVNEAPPFAYTAVDYAGPMYVRGHHKPKETKSGFVSSPAALSEQLTLN